MAFFILGFLRDGLGGIKAEAIDAIVAEEEAGVVEDEVSDLLLNRTELRLPMSTATASQT